MDTTWFLHEHHVVSMCTPCGFQIDTTMFQMWTPYDFNVKNHNVYIYGQNMVSIWTPFGFHEDKMWLPHGHHMVSMWIPCGFHMNTMWCPGNHI